MHSNAWNLKSNKERLSILERTHAQKKHLLNILTAKSRLDTRAPNYPLRHTPSAPSLHQRAIEQDNHSMIRRIIKISQVRQAPSPRSQLAEVARKLNSYSSLNRTMRAREIEQENSKIFSRLIMTSPTIKRQQWLKRNIQTSKYKENLLRSKCNPHHIQIHTPTTRARPARSSRRPPSFATSTSPPATNLTNTAPLPPPSQSDSAKLLILLFLSSPSLLYRTVEIAYS